MMGFKERAFAPLVVVSLEERVPQDHFYRQLHKVLDLSFVYDLVRESYAVVGRPSIDPVVFFKLQLVMFFEDIRSERLLMRQVADRLSVRWYLGYDLDEALPDHSSLTKIRNRYGVEVFRRFFDQVVEQCQQALHVLLADQVIRAHLKKLERSVKEVLPTSLQAGKSLPLPQTVQAALREEQQRFRTYTSRWHLSLQQIRESEPLYLL